MIRGAIILASVLIALALPFGWTFPPRIEAPPAVVRGATTTSRLTLRPGDSTVEALAFLRTLRADPTPPKPPVPPAPPAPPPPPPPPDVSVIFKSLLRGVERNPSTGAFQVLLSDPAASSPQITVMGVGGRVLGDWRITAISSHTVTLSRQREVRVIPVYG